MPAAVHCSTSTSSSIHLTAEASRIFQVKEKMGILGKPASEEIVDLLCLRIYELEEQLPCPGDTVLSEDEVEDTNGRLHMDSSNSSKPPRTDGFKSKGKEESSDDNESDDNQHSKDKSLRQKTGRKTGKQTGAEGFGLKKPENAEVQDTVYHVHHDCRQCPKYKECLLKAKLSAVRHVYDTKIVTTDTPHVTVTCTCPQDQQEKHGEFPDEINSSQQYGSNIQALALVLNVLGMVSVSRIHEILSACTGMPVSTGTIQKWIEKGGEKAQPVLKRIIEALLESIRLHADETGAHVNGILMWIHTVCNESFTYLSLQAKRGYEGACAAGVLPRYKGRLIHDCWASYWKFTDVIHGLCCAHLQRELRWVIQFKKKNRQWAQALFDLLTEMNAAVEKAKSEGKKRLEVDQLKSFHDRYDKWINEGLKLNPASKDFPGKRGRKKNGKVRSLLLRMQNHKDAVLKFADDFDVTYTNNCAEASFRLIAQKRAVIGSFRSEEGAKAFTDMFSYLSSCRKHDINCYTAMLALVNGEAEKLLFPESLN